MLDALGLVVIRRGVELLRLFQPWCKWSFYLCMVSIKSPGLWRVNDQSECTDALHTPLAMHDALGLVEIRRVLE